MSQPIDFRVHVLLSFQRALWEMVTPELRGVAVTPSGPVIEARFIYEGEPTNDEEQIVAEVETYVAADFGPEIGVRFVATSLPSSMTRFLDTGEEWVYLRREGE